VFGRLARKKSLDKRILLRTFYKKIKNKKKRVWGYGESVISTFALLNKDVHVPIKFYICSLDSASQELSIDI
jgi:hypothetical protein